MVRAKLIPDCAGARRATASCCARSRFCSRVIMFCRFSSASTASSPQGGTTRSLRPVLFTAIVTPGGRTPPWSYQLKLLPVSITLRPMPLSAAQPGGHAPDGSILDLLSPDLLATNEWPGLADNGMGRGDGPAPNLLAAVVLDLNTWTITRKVDGKNNRFLLGNIVLIVDLGARITGSSSLRGLVTLAMAS